MNDEMVTARKYIAPGIAPLVLLDDDNAHQIAIEHICGEPPYDGYAPDDLSFELITISKAELEDLPEWGG